MDSILNGEGLLSLISLTFMEIVLGIDNIVFISILSHRLPKEIQQKSRTIGLLLAIVTRIGLLLGITWIMKLDKYSLVSFTFMDEFYDFSIRNFVLFLGGLFLIYKSTREIHEKLEGASETGEDENKKHTFLSAVVQIILLDIVFSFDSILTAIGLGNSVLIMVIAVVISMGIMLLSATKISDFIEKHPTVKVLSLAFLLMIGVLLIGEGIGFEIPKGYVYFAIFFSLFVEFLNLKLKTKKRSPIKLKNKYDDKLDT